MAGVPKTYATKSVLPVQFGETVQQKLEKYQKWLPKHLALLTEEDAREPLDIFEKIKHDVQSPPEDIVIKQPGQNIFASVRNRLGLILRNDPRVGNEKPQGIFANDMQHQDHFMLRPLNHAPLTLLAFKKIDEAKGKHGFSFEYGIEGYPSVRIKREQLIDQTGQFQENFNFSNLSKKDVEFDLEMGSQGKDIFQARSPDNEQLETHVTRRIIKPSDKTGQFLENSFALEASHQLKNETKNKTEIEKTAGFKILPSTLQVVTTTYSLNPNSKASPLQPIGNDLLRTRIKVPAGVSDWPVSVNIITSSTRHGKAKAIPVAYQKTWDSFSTTIGMKSTSRSMRHLSKMWETSFKDLGSMTIPVQCGEATFYPTAAGVPNFVALFGRDALISALQTIQLNPMLARDTLAALAYYQGKKTDSFTEEEPGKILHELRQGELTRLGITPHNPYYGTIDATPLFVMLFDEYFKRTPDPTLQRILWPNFEAALQWVDSHIIDNPANPLNGFLAQRDSAEEASGAVRLKNIGWKDSDAATRHVLGLEGKLNYGKYPLALAEVQAYVYGAWRSAETLYAKRAQSTQDSAIKTDLFKKSKAYGKKAEELKKRFNEKFWMPKENFIAMALQSDGQPLESVSSNGVQALITGIVDESKVAQMVPRLMKPDMLSGWGVRTLSANAPAYDPLSYHNGSIWPHDNSLIVKGLVRYGYKTEANIIASQLLEAGQRFPNNRLPELYAGLPREKHDRSILLYPNTCSPQTWSAGTTPLLIASLLGLQVDEKTKTVTFNQPVLPSGVKTMELTLGNIPAKVRSNSQKLHELGVNKIDQLIYKTLDTDTLTPGESVTVRLEQKWNKAVKVTKIGGSPEIKVVSTPVNTTKNKFTA